MQNAEFERCADFLARMIEKYGDEVQLPKEAEDISESHKTDKERDQYTHQQKS